MGPPAGASGPNLTMYIDNNNTIEALARNVAPIISAMTQLICHRIRTMWLDVWFDRDPSILNIAELPTMW